MFRVWEGHVQADLPQAGLVAGTGAATNTPRRVDSARVQPNQMVLLVVLPQDKHKKRTNVWTPKRTTAISALEVPL